MSSRGEAGRWLLCYPKAWRERYGQELTELIAATSGPGPLPWRVRVDLLRSGIRERLAGTGLGGGETPPERRARGGVLLVMCAWAVMLVGGGVLQRFSENWREVTPAADRGLPGGAYDALIVSAALAGLLVILGIALALPRLVAHVRDAGWGDLRAPLGRALESTALAALATTALVIWSRQLDTAQRNGHDLAYAIGFLLWGVAAVACLASWTVLAARAAGRIELSARTLRTLTLIAAAVAVCMTLATIAMAVWWGALASAAPWALGDMPAGAAAAEVTRQLLLAGVLMALGAGLSLRGAGQALRARGALPG